MVCPLPQPAQHARANHHRGRHVASDRRAGVSNGFTGARCDFAAVSHVPHVLAYALMNHVADSNLSDDKFAMAGAGFRDFTRIAAASPEMWRDVCLNNREAILHDLDVYLAHAQQLRDKIAASDGDEILRIHPRQ